MCGVDLDRIEARGDRVARGFCPGADHRPALFGGELVRGQPSLRDRRTRRAHRLPNPGSRLDLF